MKWQNRHIFWMLTCILSFFGCSGDDEPTEQEVEYCVSMAWSNGRGGETRASLQSLLNYGSEKGELALMPADYPEEIQVRCNEKNFVLTKSTSLTSCTVHSGFFNGYTSDYVLKDTEAKKGVTATATMADGETLYCNAEDVKLEGTHLQFTFHHRKALVRFLFKVDADYDKIRYINVTGVSLLKEGAGAPINAQMKANGLVLTKTGLQCAGYFYIDPVELSSSKISVLSCTYDIYDKDADFSDPAIDNSAHLTRKDVVATNQVQLGKILLNGAAVSRFEAGYYYDLNITINPDYLYVLSEHDNKQHLKVE